MSDASVRPIHLRPPDTRWSGLGPGARAFRVAHAAWSAGSLASLGYVWVCAVARRRDRPLAASVAFLSLEGLALIVGRGDCPMAGFQRRLGDSVPLFELVLPARAAKAAIPVLAAVTIVGFGAIVVRPPLGTPRSRRVSQP